MTIKISAQCAECHGELSVVWIDPEDEDAPEEDWWKLTIERCKNCVENAYDDGVIIGAMHGAPRVEQPEEKRVWCPHEDKSCKHCGVEEICEIPTEPCLREESTNEWLD